MRPLEGEEVVVCGLRVGLSIRYTTRVLTNAIPINILCTISKQIGSISYT